MAGRDPRRGKVGQPLPLGVPVRNAACAGEAPANGEHAIARAGQLLYCRACGCYAERRGIGLARRCEGPPDRRNPAQRGRWKALIAMRKGKHPLTGRAVEAVQ